MGIPDAIRRADARKAHEYRRADYERQAARREVQRRQFVTDYCEPATPREYAAWLAGYLRTGGRISTVHDYPMTDRGVTVVGDGDPSRGPLEFAPADLSWFVLRSRPDDVPSLYGALSMQVIVPATVAFGPADVPRTFHGQCGHSTFYFMDGFRVVGTYMPLFPDVRALLEGMEG